MLKEVFESISEKMKGDFDTVTKMVCHPVVKGTARENALMKYLRPHIPDKFEFSEGVIIDIKKEQQQRKKKNHSCPSSKKKCTNCMMNAEKKCAKTTVLRKR